MQIKTNMRRVRRYWHWNGNSISANQSNQAWIIKISLYDVWMKSEEQEWEVFFLIKVRRRRSRSLQEAPSDYSINVPSSSAAAGGSGAHLIKLPRSDEEDEVCKSNKRTARALEENRVSIIRRERSSSYNSSCWLVEFFFIPQSLIDLADGPPSECRTLYRDKITPRFLHYLIARLRSRTVPLSFYISIPLSTTAENDNGLLRKFFFPQLRWGAWMQLFRVINDSEVSATNQMRHIYRCWISAECILISFKFPFQTSLLIPPACSVAAKYTTTTATIISQAAAST